MSRLGRPSQQGKAGTNQKDAYLLLAFILGLPIASYAFHIAYVYASAIAFSGSTGIAWRAHLEGFSKALTAFNLVAMSAAMIAAAVGKLRAGLVVSLVLGCVAAAVAPLVPGFSFSIFPGSVE